jgi:hypothetical protein
MAEYATKICSLHVLAIIFNLPVRKMVLTIFMCTIILMFMEAWANSHREPEKSYRGFQRTIHIHYSTLETETRNDTIADIIDGGWTRGINFRMRPKSDAQQQP